MKASEKLAALRKVAGNWDPAQHPRVENGPHGGEFISRGMGEGSTKSRSKQKSIAVKSSDEAMEHLKKIGAKFEKVKTAHKQAEEKMNAAFDAMHKARAAFKEAEFGKHHDEYLTLAKKERQHFATKEDLLHQYVQAKYNMIHSLGHEMLNDYLKPGTYPPSWVREPFEAKLHGTAVSPQQAKWMADNVLIDDDAISERYQKHNSVDPAPTIQEDMAKCFQVLRGKCGKFNMIFIDPVFIDADRTKTRRPYASPRGMINFGTNSRFTRKTLMHEMAHFVEHTEPEIGLMSHHYIAQNATGPLEPLNDITHRAGLGRPYEADEMAYPGNYSSKNQPYYGKHYEGQHTSEVISLALEIVMNKSSRMMYHDISSDPALYSYVFGVLRLLESEQHLAQFKKHKLTEELFDSSKYIDNALKRRGVADVQS